jgi:isoleucyl-tRNA synthetase
MADAYNFKQIEEEILEFWKENKIHEKLQKRNKKGQKFYFLQGPPYTSGRLHIAHAWNNSLKDIVMRYKRMQGFDVWDRAGYDMHGLPTENKVQKNLNLKYKEDIITYSMDKFVQECKKFSVENAKLMDKDLERLGVWMDYENAYYPIKNEFIEGEWWLIKQAFKQNRLYKGKKIMHWCASCETSLAKHELEYETDKDTSIFLKFRVKNMPNEFLIIWTTTPWTIPFNLGVMVNPELEYLKVRVEGEIWYVAKALAGVFINGLLGKKFDILSEFKGDKLEGLEYVHPLHDDLKQQYDKIKQKSPKAHTIWLSEEYVDTSAGTGLVHSAPGCGPEDYEVGQKYKVGPFNELNEKGQFENMSIFNGLTAKKDDNKFIECFKEKGFLIETSDVEHEYAHCWRCHKPVVFRTTEQWFMKIEDLVENMIQSNEKVKWVPDFATKGFDQWVSGLKDNSISRQRFWGAPVPIWECDSCKNVIVIESREELKKLKADKIPDDLHRPWIDEVTISCPKCKKSMKRVPDVIDVWIDSGTASWNCLEYPIREDYFKKYFPADFILEATEQIRLWFSMLTICSTIAFNKNCYNNVYCHGMILDYQGMKMSKSLGNIISPYEVIDKYGADILRYYMCQTAAGENINFNWEEVKQKQRSMIVLWNVHKFLIDMCNENKINPNDIDEKEIIKKCSIEEKYIFSKLNSTIKNVTDLFESYKIDQTIGLIEALFLALSRTYMQMVRDKSSLGTKDEKEVVAYTIYSVIFESLKMFSTIAPFICEKIYQNLKHELNIKEDSIHSFVWPKPNSKLIDNELESNMDIASELLQAISFAREKANLGLRWPVKDVLIASKEPKVISALKQVKEILKVQANIKEIIIKEALPNIKKAVKADYAKIGPDFGALAPKIIAKFVTDSPETILKHIEDEGAYRFSVDGKKVEVLMKHVIVERQIPSNIVENEFKYGFIYLNKERNDELESEGFAREIMRRVQVKRKEAGLQKSDRISLFLKVDDELNSMLSKFEEQIKEKVGASAFKISTLEPSKTHAYSSSEKVKDKQFAIHFDKL